MSPCLLGQLLPPQTSRKTPPTPRQNTLLHPSAAKAERRAGGGSTPLISKSHPCSRGRTAGMSPAQWEWHPHRLHIPKPTCWGTPVLMRHLPRDVDIPGHQTGSQLFGDDDTSLSSLPPQGHLPGAGFVPLPTKPPRQKERIPPADSPRLPFVLLQHLATTQCQGRAPRSVVWIEIPDL